MLSTIFSYAQVTTSSLTGVVKDNKNEPLIGATVKATHLPSGTVYGTISQADGRFTIPNMRVGGPYKVEVTFIGYVTRTYDNIALQLGVPGRLNVQLEDNSKSLNEVEVIYNRNAIISPERQGTQTSLSQQQLQTLPTVTRNINDFARLVPQAQPRRDASDGSTMGISFAGASHKYNQFTIDGANATDVFGLAASGTNGGQAGINPIPFDAIEQVQIVLSPYDVTLGGFTGGGVNAVTRSGSNEFHGSVYGFNQNQSFVGKSADTREKYGDFHDWTFGARLGGPIIKDKLFFFVNYEGERRSRPLDFQPGSGASSIDVNTVKDLSDFLKNESQHPGWSYDPGAYNGIDIPKVANSVFARIDWNINDKNKLTIRHSFVKGHNLIISDSRTAMSFLNNGYQFNSTNNSSVIELSTNISSRYSNMLRLTYNATRDNRSTPGNPFPAVSISENGATYRFGTEFSSQANRLDQDNYTITDNFNIYAGKHTITVGTDNQFYNTKNVFLQGVLGSYSYSSIADFKANQNLQSYSTNYSSKGKGDLAASVMHAAQFGLYIQDAFDIADNFKLTYGIRADMPVFFNKPAANDYFNSSDLAKNNDVATDKMPKSRILLSPRAGFNWDVKKDGTTQLRGGVGLFTGRVPFVWISNQYAGTGVARISYSANNAAAVQAAGITFTPNDPYQPAASGSTPPPTEIDVTERDFKFPRILRANLAIDQKLPFGFIGTIEGIYTKTVQDILYHDLNLAPSTTSINLENTTRPFYGTLADPRFTKVLALGNTDKGYSYNVTAQLQRAFSHGWYGSISYSLGHSYTVNDGTSSTASSNFRYAYNINGLNNLDLTRSNYDQGSRIVGFVSKKFKYGRFATNISLVYTGQSGMPLSYVYFGDINGDDGTTATSANTSNSADIMYIPTSAAQFTTLTTNGVTYTPEQQFAMFQDYVNSNDYLREHQGKNTERNGARLPWENHFDLKLGEDFAVYKDHTLSLTVDIFNIGNLLNKNWGRAYYPGNSNQELQPLNLAKTASWIDANTPAFTFNPQFGLNKYTSKPWAYSNFLSRWNMQVGVRYSF
ncbi:MAG TPA: TonB-dependent receptor [Chitinophaga sp.]|uniref:TonB-dependent receptor n=1 Tax=Chitinophaga sp. TaxID=1869181 RepID=UPI002DBDF008|nr:TonB-dependent receptor [Chitinophaga sp.]HEU4552254.1 TonB-dependent receptor [Chitinophaga sp.]